MTAAKGGSWASPRASGESLGAPPPGPFVAVAATTLGGAHRVEGVVRELGEKERGTKRNPLEFMSLLMSLTKW